MHKDSGEVKLPRVELQLSPIQASHPHHKDETICSEDKMLRFESQTYSFDRIYQNKALIMFPYNSIFNFLATRFETKTCEDRDHNVSFAIIVPRSGIVSLMR